MRGLPHCVDCKCTSFYFHLGYSWSHSRLLSPATHLRRYKLLGVNVLWCHSYLVRLVFEGSIPTWACFHSENFFVALIIHIHKSANLSGDSSNYYRMAGGIIATIHWWSLNRKHGQGLAGRETLGLKDLEQHATLRWVDNTCLIIWFKHPVPILFCFIVIP